MYIKPTTFGFAVRIYNNQQTKQIKKSKFAEPVVF